MAESNLEKSLKVSVIARYDDELECEQPACHQRFVTFSEVRVMMRSIHGLYMIKCSVSRIIQCACVKWPRLKLPETPLQRLLLLLVAFAFAQLLQNPHLT